MLNPILGPLVEKKHW